MNQFINGSLLYRIVVILLIVILSVWVLQQYVVTQFAAMRSSFDSEIQATTQQLAIWQDDGVDTATLYPSLQVLVETCTSSERREFEAVLGQLGTGLQRPELADLRAWFDRCGTVVARERLVTATQIAAQVNYLEGLLMYYEAVPTLWSESAEHAINIEEWRNWSEAWQDYSTKQVDLDELQRELIEARYTGAAVGSTEISELLNAVEMQRDELAAAQAAVQSAFANISI